MAGLASSGGCGESGGLDGPADAGAGDGDSDADSDADSDSDSDSNLDADAELPTDAGPHDADQDQLPGEDAACVLDATWVEAALERSSCPPYDDPDLPDLVIDGDCVVDTDACSLSCLTPTAPSCQLEVEADLNPGASVCIMVARSVEVAATASLTVSGTNGWALVSAEAIVVAGRIDANGRGNADSPGGFAGGGAGSDGGGAARSEWSTGGRAGPTGTASGGGGGGLGGQGGAGGCSTETGGDAHAEVHDPGCGGSSFIGGAGGAGGSAGPGCAGANAGVGGAGGGFIYLFSRVEVRVLETAHISADGADGTDAVGCDRSGGGGGGSGGTVWLEAGFISIAGMATALGGSGGSAPGPVLGGAGGGSPDENGQDGYCGSATDVGGGAGGGAGRVVLASAGRTLLPGSYVAPRIDDCLWRELTCSD